MRRAFETYSKGYRGTPGTIPVHEVLYVLSDMGVFEGLDASSAGCLVCTELQRIFSGKSHARLFEEGEGGGGGVPGSNPGGSGEKRRASDAAAAVGGLRGSGETTAGESAREKLARGLTSVRRNVRTLLLSKRDAPGDGGLGADERAYAIATAAAAGGRGEMSADEVNAVAAALRSRQRKPLYAPPDLQPEVPQFDQDTAEAVTRAARQFASKPPKRFDEYGRPLPDPPASLTPAQFASLVFHADLLDPGFTPHAVGAGTSHYKSGL